MKQRYEKNVRVLTDVMSYCNMLGALELHADLKMETDVSYITVCAHLPDVPREEIEQIDRFLNIPRQREVEQNYWNISAEENADGELSLAGMMVDLATVTYEDDQITIVLERYDKGEPD